MTHQFSSALRLLAGMLWFAALTNAALGLTTAFTYQGRLTDGPNLATGKYDLKFQLYNAEAGGLAVTSPLSKDDLLVTNGLFTVELDFGANIFNGENYWLEISVRPSAETGGYTLLTPRQAITPAPYASYSALAGSAAAANSVAWSSITGIPAGFADGVDNDTLYFAGSGLSLAGT